MTLATPDHKKLEEIFSKALEKESTDEINAYLDKACGEDTRMRIKVTNLLSANEKAGSFLEEPPVNPEAQVEDTTAGTMIGRYKILQKIGEGGFGTVYMAEQMYPVQRKVALKIIKLGMDTKQVIARFEVEQQALAMMDHPNIARVLDAGATDRGRPYFVMELVKGITITEYCDQNRLTSRERLELMIPVCQAVQHAHQKGIIHRDLKPSNVLVALQENRPVPKVIDFGIAKATTQRLTDKTLFTEFRQFIGTPEYMSPDQAEVSGLDMDTRTDVYSLGVMIYELLTGTTPFTRQMLVECSYDEIRQIIREEEPPRPSTRLQTLDSTPTGSNYAKLRQAEPGALTKLISGDLDWIVMKALEKDRTRRYTTAKDLADDLTRFLKHEPVEAGPPDMGYKVRKFIRRHRASVIVGTIIGVTLITGLSIATVGLVEANKARAVLTEEKEAADKARKSAEEHRVKAEASATEALNQVARSSIAIEFLEQMLRSVDPSKALGREVSVRFVLDEAVANIDDGALAAQPDVEVALRITIGETYRALGHYPAAENTLRAAGALARHSLGETHPESLRADRALAGTLRMRGAFSEAETLLRETARKQREVLGEEHEDTLATMNELALALWGPGRFQEAESIHRQILNTQQRVLGEDHEDTVKSLGHLGAAVRAQGKIGEAEPLLRRTLDQCLRLLGEDHPFTAEAKHNLAMLREDQHDEAEAEKLFRETYELDHRILGPDHPQTRIHMNNLMRILRIQGKTQALQPLAAENIAMLKRASQRPEATALAHYHYSWELLHCEIEALRDPVKALPAAQLAVDQDHGKEIDFLENLAVAYKMTGDLAQATETQRRALSQARARGLQGIDEIESRLFDYVMGQGDLAAAVSYSWDEVADNVGGWLLPTSSPDTSVLRQGEALVAEERFSEAASLLRGFLTLQRKTLPEGHGVIAETLSLLGFALAGDGQFKEAEPLLLEAITLLQKNPLVMESRKQLTIKRILSLYRAWDKPEALATWQALLIPSTSEPAVSPPPTQNNFSEKP